MAFLLAYGRSMFFPLLPHAGVQMTQVFGKPIPVPIIDDPSQAQINEIQEKYIAEISRLYTKYSKTLGYQDRELRIL